MQRTFLLACFATSTLLLGSPALAGGDGTAGGNSGFNPVGGSALTPIGTADFTTTTGSRVEVPVASFALPSLTQALVNGGLSPAGGDGVLALLLNQEVNGLTPQQGAATLARDLQAAGAGAAQAMALAEALGQLGASPSLQSLNAAVTAFNALVSAADAGSLQALAGEITPIRAFLISVIENVKVVAG